MSTLANHLSRLLFSHVHEALLQLQEDVDGALDDIGKELSVIIGEAKTTPEECRIFLSQLRLDFYEICKAAVNGNYFQSASKGSFVQCKPQFVVHMPPYSL